jgi:hypothetical protein
MMNGEDRKTIRDLAARWAETASLPVMAERKRLWKAVHDLKMERPMILVETGAFVDEYVPASELVCRDPILRNVEKYMRGSLRDAAELGDDTVLEPYFRLPWELAISDFGVPVETRPAVSCDGTSLGYSFNFPIAKPEEITKLKKRTFGVDREKTLSLKSALEEVMGDILPVKIGNYDHFDTDYGNNPWTGIFFFGLTWQIYRFIGNNGLLYWLYDAPDTIHRLMAYMRDDRIGLFEFLVKENLLDVNTDTQMAGPRAYGYVSGLPGPGHRGPVKLKDLWGWAESQESTVISPAMFGEFVLPYLAELSAKFGLIYYGCCEPLHDRLELIMKAIPNLRSVSVSGWADFRKMADMIGRKYVFSRKPTPAYISGPNPDWELLKKDMQKTKDAAGGCNVEILFRDVYTIDNDWPRLRKWVEMTKAVFGI